MDRWEWLINNARLDIIEFDISVHDTFKTETRIFPFYMMSYIKEGAAEALIKGETYKTPPGTLLLIPPYMKHVHYIPEGAGQTTFLWWHFTLTIDGDVDLMRLVNLPYTLAIKNTLHFESIFCQYVELYKRRECIPNYILKRAKGLEVMAYLFESILDAVPEQTRLMSDIPDGFFEILTGIVEHPERRVSLGEMAETYYMNATYISNRFKKLFGLTPLRLQHNILTNKAKLLLSAQNTSIGDIAQALGFPDVSSFTRFFNERVGCAPSAYKDKFSMPGCDEDASGTQ